MKTTLDLDMQEYVQATIAAEVSKLKSYRVSNGAALVTKLSTGEILYGRIDRLFRHPFGII